MPPQQQLQLIGCSKEESAVPNCDFYAAPSDFEPVLRFIFEDMECRSSKHIHGSTATLGNSRFEDYWTEPTEAGDCSNSKLSCFLMLWPLRASMHVRVRRIELDPATRLGKYRHAVEGWGLISLQLGGLAKGRDCIHLIRTTTLRAARRSGPTLTKRPWVIRRPGIGMSSPAHRRS